MADLFADVFAGDAFSAKALTAAINNLDFVPGRAGQLVFQKADVTKPLSVTKVAVEYKDSALTLIPTTPHGGPTLVEPTPDKASLFSFDVPHVALEDTINAASVQDVCEFGTTNRLPTVQSVVNQQLVKMTQRLDLTLEYFRLGALQGVILDADGSTLTDYFSEFGILNSDGEAAPELFDHFLDGTDRDNVADSVRIKCQSVLRHMQRNLKAPWPNTAQLWAFCGDEFFDTLIDHPTIRSTWDGFGSAETIARKSENYAFGLFEFGGIMFENYRGTDDETTVAIASDEACIFLTGVPGLYEEYFAPADFMETINTPGLPRYAKIAPDKRFNRQVFLLAEMNPLPICLRPQTLVRAKIGAA